MSADPGRPGRSLGVLLLSFDGIQSWHCGVGTGTVNFIRAMPEVAEVLAARGVEVSFTAAGPLYGSGCLGHSPSLLAEHEATCRAVRGDVRLHWDGTDGTSQYGGPDQWRATSDGGAGVVLDEVRRYDELVVVAFDTPYAGVAASALRQLRTWEGAWPRFVWVPHSTGANHALDDPSGARSRWERDAVRPRPGCHVGAIGPFMREHLVRDFGVPQDRVVDLRNGLALGTPLPRASADDVARRLGIDMSVPTVFATGRAERYKGFAELVRSFAAGPGRGDAQLVLVLSTLTQQDPSFEEVARLIRELRLRATVVEAFLPQPELAALLAHPNVRVLALPSLAEPMSALPMETWHWCGDDSPVIVASDRDGFRDSIVEGLTGLRAEPTDPIAFGRALTAALALGDNERRAMAAAGHRSLRQTYDYARNICAMLEAVLEAVQEHRP